VCVLHAHSIAFGDGEASRLSDGAKRVAEGTPHEPGITALALGNSSAADQVPHRFCTTAIDSPSDGCVPVCIATLDWRVEVPRVSLRSSPTMRQH